MKKEKKCSVVVYSNSLSHARARAASCTRTRVNTNYKAVPLVILYFLIRECYVEKLLVTKMISIFSLFLSLSLCLLVFLLLLLLQILLLSDGVLFYN